MAYRQEGNQGRAGSKQDSAAQTSTDDQPASLPDRRKFLSDVLKGAGALVAGASGAGLIAQMQKPSFESMYGSLEAPHFRVREELGLSGTRPFRDKLQQMENSRDLSSNTASSFERAIGAVDRKLTEALNSHETPASVERLSDADVLKEIDAILDESSRSSQSTTTAGIARVSDLQLELFDLQSELDRERFAMLGQLVEGALESADQAAGKIIDSKSSHVSLEEKFGDPESYTRALIERVTGKPLPAQAKFEIRPIDDAEVAGFSIAAKQLIVTEDGHYARVILVNAHEAGHLLAQHEEEVGVFSFGARNVREIDAWEEACAYAFQAVASEAIQHEELGLARVLMSSNQRSLLEQYYSGEQSEECHRLGMAYFDAALTVLGSASKAYNYLSSNRELTDEMKAVIRSNAERFKGLQGESEQPRLRKIERLLAELEKRFDAVSFE